MSPYQVTKATGLLAQPSEWGAHLALLLDECKAGLHAGGPVGKWWVVASGNKGEKGTLRFVKPGLPGVRPLGTMTVEAEATAPLAATLDPADPASHTHPDREPVADDPAHRRGDPPLTFGQVATLRASAVAALHTYRAGLLEIGAQAGAERVTSSLKALGAAV